MALPTIYSIPVEEACAWTRRWRDAGNTIRAFTIDVAELNDIINELGKLLPDPVRQVRVYFGYKDTGEECLVLVGVDAEGKDIVYYWKRDEALGADATEESGTYDFTRPCPSTCDEGSPLNGGV